MMSNTECNICIEFLILELGTYKLFLWTTKVPFLKKTELGKLLMGLTHHICHGQQSSD